MGICTGRRAINSQPSQILARLCVILKTYNMKVKIFLLKVFVLFIGLAGLRAQSKTDIKQQFASLGDFTLESGQKIMDCKIGYRTFGTLNATKSNGVISL